MKEPPLKLEEIIYRAKEDDYLELPLSKKAFFLIGALSLIVILIVFFRFFVLNIVKGENYQARAQDNINDEFYFPAERGIIFDRFGAPLVKNIDASGVFLDLRKFLKNTGTINEVITKLSDILNINTEELKNLIENADFEKNRYLKIATDISSAQIKELLKLNLPFVEIKNDFIREYFDGLTFAHVLGYTGISSGPEVEGKTGLEAYYNQFLKGEAGKFIIYKNAKGKVLDEKTISNPRIGRNIEITIDAEFQKYFYETLENRLKFLGKQAGVGIALDPRNGEVLALVSLPSFDNNLFSFDSANEERLKILNSSSKPLFNRAVSGLYVPGSTIKPLVALAALKEKIIDQNFQIYSPGYIEIPNPYNPETPSRFLDWKTHGWVNLHSALAVSSNVYFYAIGGGLPRGSEVAFQGLENIKGLGIQKLYEYWKKFGFGEKTEIDLPFEGVGYLPNSVKKEERKGDIWRVGDTYNVSIGQGDILVTPIQLISFISSIANSGKIYKPHLIKQVLDENQEIIYKVGPEELINYSDWVSEIKEVQTGMKDAVRMLGGTAYSLNDLPVSAAAKTGTAQVFGRAKNNAFFVGYAPANEPKIVLLVLIEDVPKEGGHNAVPVAKKVFDWYYWNRLIKQQ
jgi:penicillin-binding protein 2